MFLMWISMITVMVDMKSYISKDLSPSVTETWMFPDKYINTMAADDMTTYISKLEVTTVSNMQYTWVLVFLKEGFQLHT